MEHVNPADHNNLADFMSMRMVERTMHPERFLPYELLYAILTLDETADEEVSCDKHKRDVTVWELANNLMVSMIESNLTSREKLEETSSFFQTFLHYFDSEPCRHYSRRLHSELATALQGHPGAGKASLYPDEVIMLELAMFAAEFGSHHFKPPTYVLKLHSDCSECPAVQRTNDLSETICLHCALACALNSKTFVGGFRQPYCRLETAAGIHVDRQEEPAADSTAHECSVCCHAKEVHFQPVSGCGNCTFCLKHSGDLNRMIAKVACQDVPMTDDPNTEWSRKPVLNRKMILVHSLGLSGSMVYSRVLGELVAAIRCLLPVQITAPQASKDLDHDTVEVADSLGSIDAPIPRIFTALLENGLEPLHPRNHTEWLKTEVMNACFCEKPLTALKISRAIALNGYLPIGNGMEKEYIRVMDGHTSGLVLIRAGEAVLAVDKMVCGLWLFQLGRFVRASIRSAGLPSTSPVIDVNHEDIFCSVAVPEALSIVKLHLVSRLGKDQGKIGKIYEATAGRLRLAVKVVDLNEGVVDTMDASLEAHMSTLGGKCKPISSWININEGKQYILMARYTQNLYQYIEEQKQDLNDLSKIVRYRVTVIYILAEVLRQLQSLHKNRRVHGDIHEGNVLLFTDENHSILSVALADFGFAYQRTDYETPTTTPTCVEDDAEPSPCGPSWGSEANDRKDDLDQLRNIAQYMLKGVETKYLSDNEISLSGLPCRRARGVKVDHSIGEMLNSADAALQRTMMELVFLLRLSSEEFLVDGLPYETLDLLKKTENELPQRAEMSIDQLKAVLIPAKPEDLLYLIQSMDSFENMNKKDRILQLPKVLRNSGGYFQAEFFRAIKEDGIEEQLSFWMTVINLTEAQTSAEAGISEHSISGALDTVREELLNWFEEYEASIEQPDDLELD